MTARFGGPSLLVVDVRCGAVPVDRRSPFARGYSQLVRERVERVRVVAAEQPELSFMEWAVRVPEPKAGPLDFDRFPFQRELYNETGFLQEVVVKKATQIGVSAYLVRWTMMVADVKGWNVIYVFPKLNLMWDFSDARVKPLIEASAYLRGRVSRAHTQNKGLKRIGSGFVYYRGSESTAALESIDADALALDEYDSLVAANVPVVERRTTGSPHGLIRRVGVPSVPGFGLDVLYEESDQRRWFVKCDRCKRHQPIYFREGGNPDGELSAFVDQEQVLVVCGRCRKPIDVAGGEWVPAYPERDVRGYHASRLIVPAVARNDRGMLGEIVKASLSPEPFIIQGFHNRDLGEAYAPKEGRLSLEALQAAQEPGLFQQTGYTGSKLVTAGIDVASVRALNMRISEHLGDGTKRALYIGQVGDFDAVEQKLLEFRVNLFCIDHLPEGRLARALCQKFPGRGFLTALTGSALKSVIAIDDENHSVTVRRTEAVDAMMAMIRTQRNVLPQDLPEGYAKQMQAPVRFIEQDEVGKMVVGYRSSGADDYAMAELFDVVAGDVWKFRVQSDAMNEGEIIALEERLEFQRAHLNEPEKAGGYSPGLEGGGYSAGFSDSGDDGLFDDPYAAYRD